MTNRQLQAEMWLGLLEMEKSYWLTAGMGRPLIPDCFGYKQTVTSPILRPDIDQKTNFLKVSFDQRIGLIFLIMKYENG